jgi:hypothetical protein
MAAIWFSISSSTLGILASRWMRTKLVSLNQEAPWPLDPLESSFHDHGISELKPRTIELNLRNETVPTDEAKRNETKFSTTGQPKRNLRIKINLLTPALLFRHHTCKDATAIGPVRGKHAACSALTWPAGSIWGSGCQFVLFFPSDAAQIRRNAECRGKGIDLQQNRHKQEAREKRRIFFL